MKKTDIHPRTMLHKADYVQPRCKSLTIDDESPLCNVSTDGGNIGDIDYGGDLDDPNQQNKPELGKEYNVWN